MSGDPCPKQRAARLTAHAEQAYRRRVVVEVYNRDNGVCRAAALVPSIKCVHYGCTAHEVVQRSVRPGSHLEPDLCVWICGAHHDWVHDNIADARPLGLIRDSWEVDDNGQLKPLGAPLGSTEGTQRGAA